MLSPNDYPIVLLPQDRELMAILGCSEGEYRDFLRDCAKASGIKPGEPTNFLVIPFLVQLVVGVALSLLATYLFRPKLNPNRADIRQTSSPGQNVVGRSEYAPKAGF